MIKSKPLIDDFWDVLSEDRSFKETMLDFFAGKLGDKQFKHELAVIRENVDHRLLCKDEDAMDARKRDAS